MKRFAGNPWGLMLIGLALYWIGSAADFPALAGIGVGSMLVGFSWGAIKALR